MTPTNFKPVEEQLAYLKKGAAEIIPEAELKSKLENSLKTATPLRVYLGVDPTAPDIHLGHTVVLRKLKHFQDLGHTAIFLIGDFSAMIGDPTGQSETRPPLTREQVDANAKTYLEQVYKILDRQKTEVRYNSEWLDKLSSYDIVRLCGRYSLARMLEREDFRSRLKNNQPISVHELLYPLLTAWDAVALQSDVEIGATEQKFNLLVHRDIQIAVHREEAVTRQLENPDLSVEYSRRGQACVTMPILVGLDGQRKMSKSLGNYIGITESPTDIFGKIMSISDALMWPYFELLTDRPADTIRSLQQNVSAGTTNPKQVKISLASEIVRDFYGEAAALAAANAWDLQFSKREVPEDTPVKHLPEDSYVGSKPGNMRLWRILVNLNAAASRTKAEQLIKDGAVDLDGTTITDPTFEIDLGIPRKYLLKVGKKQLLYFVVR